MQNGDPGVGEMAAGDSDIALRKINADENQAELEKHNVDKLPQVNVYNRSGSLVGSVVGADVDKIKSYVAQAKGG